MKAARRRDAHNGWLAGGRRAELRPLLCIFLRSADADLCLVAQMMLHLTRALGKGAEVECTQLHLTAKTHLDLGHESASFVDNDRKCIVVCL